MTHTQFKLYTAQIGVKFATRMALQEGVAIAQIQLWVAQAGLARNPRELINRLTSI